MFERFGDDARRVVVTSQEEARRLDHDAIGSEHLLLALASSDSGVASSVLVAFGVTPPEARSVVRELAGEGSGPPTGHIPFTADAKSVLERSLAVALERDDTSISALHLLVALLDQQAQAVAQVIDRLVDDRDALRAAVLVALDEPRPPDARARVARVELRSAAAVGRLPGPPGGNVPRCSLCGRPEDPDQWSVVARGTIVCGECLREALASIDAAAEKGDAPTRLRYRRAGSEPVDPTSARAGIERCFAAVFPGRPVGDRGDRTWAVEPGAGVADDLAVMEAGANNAPMTVVDVTVERINFLDPEHAEVSIGIWMAGNPSPMLLPGQAVVVDGTWRVSRDTLAWFAGQTRQFRSPPGRPG
jgi:hypothetical protein